MPEPWKQYQSEQSGPWDSYQAPSSETGQSTTRSEYESALENVRRKYFADVPDERWREHAPEIFGPYGAHELAQHSGTLGFSNEIASMISALRGLPGQITGQGPDVGEAWEDFSRLHKARLDLGREEQGGLGTAAEIVGGLGAVGPGKAITAARTIPQAMFQGAREGAPLGFAYGFGEADEGDLRERTQAGLTTGAITGGIAASLPPLIRAGQNIATSLGRLGMPQIPKAVRNLSRALQRDQIPADQALPRLRELGPDAMVADLGENLRRQAGGIATVPGRGQTTLTQSTLTRAAPPASSARVASDLQRTIGTSRPAFAVADDIIRQQSAAAKPLYDAVRGVPVQLTDDMSRILETPTGKRALRKAINMMADDGIQASAESPTVGLLDYVKRALDDITSTAQRAGKGNEARIAGGMARRLRDAIDNQVPAYAQAREAFAGPAAVLDALEAGQDVFTTATRSQRFTHPDQLRTHLGQMTQSERQAFMQGAQSSLQDMLGTARSEPAKVRQLFGGGFNREKLAVLIGDDAADDLLRSIERELIFSRTNEAVAGGSKTAATQAAQSEVAPGVRQVSSRDRTVLGTIEQMINTAFRGAAGMRREAVNSEMARLLTMRAGELPADLLEQLSYLGRVKPPAVTLPPTAIAPAVLPALGGPR